MKAKLKPGAIIGQDMQVFNWESYKNKYPNIEDVVFEAKLDSYEPVPRLSVELRAEGFGLTTGPLLKGYWNGALYVDFDQLIIIEHDREAFKKEIDGIITAYSAALAAFDKQWAYSLKVANQLCNIIGEKRKFEIPGKIE